MPTHENKILPGPLWPYPLFAPFLPFTPVQPNLYWNTESPERALAELCRNLEKLIQYAEGIGCNVNQLKAFYEELNAKFDEWSHGGFDEYYGEQVKKWIQENMEFIFEHVANIIFPGITSDGYYVIWVPEGWADIDFAVPMDDNSDYGRITLEYVAEDAGHEFFRY